MSNIKLKTSKDLQRFLKIVAEQAVQKSRDEYANVYLKSYENEKKFYNLKEEEVSSSKKDQSEQDTTEPADSEDTASQDSEKDDTEVKKKARTFGASFDSLISAINKLRSGKSANDSVIRDQAAIYYERLNEAERNTLVLFMKEMAGILTGEIEGDEAQEPTDDPLNISIDQSEDGEDVVVDKPKKEKEVSDNSEEEPQDDVQSAEEDDAPPIKVNESQDLDSIRKYVRKLMG